MRRPIAAGLGFALILGMTTAFAQPAGSASAELRSSTGEVVGLVTFTQEAGGVRIEGQVRGLPPGVHGVHVHAVGRCDPPDFMSAGGHFNPTGRQHGLQNPAGPHAGDLPNLEVGPGGTGRLTAVNAMLSLGTGENSLFDADNSALVIHADPDDNMTDPAGNSGGRIACGVITRAGAAPAAQPSPAPAAKPAGQPTPAPAAKPAASPAPAQPPSALPRTGDALGLAAMAIPTAAGAIALILGGLALRRRR